MWYGKVYLNLTEVSSEPLMTRDCYYRSLRTKGLIFATHDQQLARGLHACLSRAWEGGAACGGGARGGATVRTCSRPLGSWTAGPDGPATGVLFDMMINPRSNTCVRSYTP